MSEDASYGRAALIATGWQQGSLLPENSGISPTAWASHQSQGNAKVRKEATSRTRHGDLTAPFLWQRPSAKGNRLALITQQCDVVKSPDDFPFVEFALVIETKNEHLIREAESLTSARYFRLDRADDDTGSAQILDIACKTQADKGILHLHAADNTHVNQMDDTRRSILREWLGRRLGREAVSDDDTKRIVEPIREAWKTLAAEEPETASRWNEKIAEFRFRHDASRLQLYVIGHDVNDEADTDLLVASDWAVTTASWVEEQIDVTIIDEWHFSIAEHRQSHEIDLSWASYEEAA